MTIRLSRREVLALLPALPVAVRGFAQAPPKPVVSRRIVSAAGVFSYVIEPDGRVRVWTTSKNVKGSVLGFTDDRIVPPYVVQDVPTLKGCTAIAVGGAKYAVTADGQILAWESNWSGLLGNTPLSEFEATSVPHPAVLTPVRVLGIPRAIDVAAGEKHALALTAEGEVFAWGNGQLGQLGIGPMPTIHFRSGISDTTYFLPFPTRLSKLPPVAAISAGMQHSLALTKDGTVYGWGDNQYGQVGDGSVTTQLSPVLVRGITNAIAVAAGYGFSVALLADGTAMTWGHGSGVLGRAGIKEDGPNPIPTLVPRAVGVTMISAGASHVLALTNTGRVIAWGEQIAGQVGRENAPELAGPVPQLTDVRFVHGTGLTSFAVLADGTIMVWGSLPSISYRIDGADGSAAHFPIPLVLKGL